ncbi:tape measure protein [Gordonia phage TinaLin]|uniref:Tape measure protein n=1 Tax=Gordonia phage TinaLin TaxID=2797324 RepID=A0A7T7GTE4_9CAUD|nr:tail length tape measure protein [Gordonia phage TinaLin]QQM15112.1 tape measure protein [Gordonia phage TinaLin]
MADEDAVWVPVLADMSKFARSFEGGTKKAAADGAQQMGKAGEKAGTAYADGLAKAGKKVERASAVLGRARDREADAAGKVRVAEAQLQTLRDKGVTDAGRLAAAEEKVNAAKRKNESAARASSNAEKNLASAQREQADASAKAAKSNQEASDSITVMGDSADDSSGRLKAFGALTVAAAAGAGAALFALGSDFTNMKNTIRVGTGATGEALTGMVDVAKNLGSQVPASFDEIGSTVADLNTRLGLTGEPLERLSRQFLELKNMGIDADINTVSQAFSGFGVQGAETEVALDELFRVSQATGLSVNELAQSAVKAGPQLRQFGFGLAESAALAGQLDKSGMDADKTLAGMSKALVQFAKDGKDPQQALFGTIVEIEKFVEAGNSVAAIDLAGGLFGTRGAAQFVDAVKSGTMSVDDFVSATGATSDTIMGVADETRTFSEQWQMFKNDVMAQLEPIATRVFGVITNGMSWLKDNGVPALRDFAGWLSENKTTLGVVAGVITATLMPALAVMVVAWTKAKIEAAKSAAMQLASSYKVVAGWVASGASATASAAVQGAAWLAAQAGAVAAAVKTAAYGVAMGVVRGATIAWTAAQWLLNVALNANPISLIVIGIAALIAIVVLIATKTTWFQTAWKAVWNAVKAAWDWVWNALKTGFNAFIGFFTTTIPNAVGAAKDWVVQKWNELVARLSAAVEILKGRLGQFVSFFTETIPNAVGAAKDWVIEKFGQLVDWLGGLPGRVAEKLSGLWDGLKNGFRDAINFIIDGWNNFRLNFDFTIPIIDKKVSFTIDTPNLPRLATGGVAGRDGDGMLYGPGTGTSDSILGVDTRGIPTAMVSAGEFVVNAASTRRFLPLLKALNAGELPGYADGGLVSASDLVEFAKGVEGKPYDWGGVNWGDCSGAVSALANYATGRDPFGSRFATASEGDELAARGFKPGLGPAGSLNIGWLNGGPGGGHTSATLPNGVNFEMGGARGDGQYGGGAAGADDPQYTDHMHLPPEHFGGLDAGAPTTGGGTSSGALTSSSSGGSSGGANIGGGTSSFGNSGGQSAFNSAKDARKAGVTPVWVENWPGSSSGAGATDSGVSGATGAATSSAASSGAVTSSGEAPKVEPVKVGDPFVKFATGVDMNTVRDAQAAKDPWKPADAGRWFEDPQASALDALFEVLGMSDVVKADDILPSMESRYGVAGPDHSAPVQRPADDGGSGAAPTQVVGTVVHGDVNVTDYDEFRSRQEKDEKRAMAKAGM